MGFKLSKCADRIPEWQEDRFLLEYVCNLFTDKLRTDDGLITILIEPIVRRNPPALLPASFTPRVLDFPLGGFAVDAVTKIM